jgi:hypothetical protein
MDINDVIGFDANGVEEDQSVIDLNLAEYLDEIFAFSY